MCIWCDLSLKPHDKVVFNTISIIASTPRRHCCYMIDLKYVERDVNPI